MFTGIHYDTLESAQIWNDISVNVKHMSSVQMFKLNYLKNVF